jgi:hypothetical protein
MELSRSTTTREGVTLVSVVVYNPHEEPVRFRLANELDGPVWPPRTDGRPEPGWDENGYEGELAPGESVSLGYATPAAAASPPAVIERVTRVPEGDGSGAPDAETALRQFSDPRPPRDVVASQCRDSTGGGTGCPVGVRTGESP